MHARSGPTGVRRMDALRPDGAHARDAVNAGGAGHRSGALGSLYNACFGSAPTPVRDLVYSDG